MIPMEKLDLERFRGERGQIHCVGVAGVGTLPLAQIFLENGFRVSGSDLLYRPFPSEKLSQFSIDLDCKSVREVQFLNDNNHSIIRSLSERTDKGYLSAL